ncbi:MAG: hypothetical protein AB1679_14275 [Actinomycetota bacterium]|jgi:hypothetical protein
MSKKTGRPKDPILSMYRELFPEWSDRTLRTFCKAERQWQAFREYAGEEVALEVRKEVTELASRENGSLSVRKYAQAMEVAIVLRLTGKFAGK